MCLRCGAAPPRFRAGRLVVGPWGPAGSCPSPRAACLMRGNRGGAARAVAPVRALVRLLMRASGAECRLGAMRAFLARTAAWAIAWGCAVGALGCGRKDVSSASEGSGASGGVHTGGTAGASGNESGGQAGSGGAMGGGDGTGGAAGGTGGSDDGPSAPIFGFPVYSQADIDAWSTSSPEYTRLANSWAGNVARAHTSYGSEISTVERDILKTSPSTSRCRRCSGQRTG